MDEEKLKFISKFLERSKKSEYVKIGVEQVFSVPYELSNTYIDAIMYEKPTNTVILCMFITDLTRESLKSLLRNISEYTEYFPRSKKYETIKSVYDWSERANYEELLTLLCMKSERSVDEIVRRVHKQKRKNRDAILQTADEIGVNTALTTKMYIIVDDNKTNEDYFWNNKEVLIDNSFQILFFNQETGHLFKPDDN